MTRYTVVWHVDAENELAEQWLAANDRDAVTLATNTIDSHLAADADRKGDCRRGGISAYLSCHHCVCCSPSASRIEWCEFLMLYPRKRAGLRVTPGTIRKCPPSPIR
jgi:hypothetical protein